MQNGTSRMRAKVWARRVLPQPRWAGQQDVGLLKLHVVVAGVACPDAFAVVVYGHAQDLLRPLLADYVLFQPFVDGPGVQPGTLRSGGGARGGLFVYDLLAQRHALRADEYSARPTDEPLDLDLVLATEGADNFRGVLSVICHVASLGRAQSGSMPLSKTDGLRPPPRQRIRTPEPARR